MTLEMTLEEILVRYGIDWPNGADYCYQSSIDSEIYFKNDYGMIIKRTKRNPVATAGSRGEHNRLYRRRFINYRDGVLGKGVLENPDNSAMFKNLVNGLKSDPRQKLIKRIEKGLKDDFDIDSRELAVVMFEKGWRK